VEEQIINKALEITPAGMGGYGLALAVCIVVAIVFYRRWIQADDYIKALTKESMEGLRDTTENYIRTQEQINNRLSNIEHRLNN